MAARRLDRSEVTGPSDSLYPRTIHVIINAAYFLKDDCGCPTPSFFFKLKRMLFSLAPLMTFSAVPLKTRPMCFFGSLSLSKPSTAFHFRWTISSSAPGLLARSLGKVFVPVPPIPSLMCGGLAGFRQFMDGHIYEEL